MIDNEFERKGREMSDKLNQIVDLEYTWGDFPALTAEQIYKAYDARAVCAQVTTCNGAAILALEKRIAELERERDAAKTNALTCLQMMERAQNESNAATKRAEQVERERDAANKKLEAFAHNFRE